MGKKQRRTKQQMYSLIEKFRQRKTTKKQFCREERIPLSVFYYWEKKYKQASQNNGQGFLPVEIGGQPKHKTNASVEIAFPNGVIMRLDSGCDIAMIRSLITSI